MTEFKVRLLDYSEFREDYEEVRVSYLLGGQQKPDEKTLIAAIDRAIEEKYGRYWVFKEFIRNHPDGSNMFLMHRAPDIYNINQIKTSHFIGNWLSSNKRVQLLFDGEKAILSIDEKKYAGELEVMYLNDENSLSMKIGNDPFLIKMIRTDNSPNLSGFFLFLDQGNEPYLERTD